MFYKAIYIFNKRLFVIIIRIAKLPLNVIAHSLNKQEGAELFTMTTQSNKVHDGRLLPEARATVPSEISCREIFTESQVFISQTLANK